jgi:hypothetical protein
MAEFPVISAYRTREQPIRAERIPELHPASISRKKNALNEDAVGPTTGPDRRQLVANENPR